LTMANRANVATPLPLEAQSKSVASFASFATPKIDIPPKTHAQTLRPPITIQGYVRLYRKLGFNVFPLKPKTKDQFLFDSWKDFQTKTITEQGIAHFWPKDSQNNIAIVTGAISGNLWVLDFDSEEGYHKAFTQEERSKLESSTLVARTGRGVHVYFRYKDAIEPRNQSAMTPDGKVDVRANGGYVVAAPSIHPSGKQYTIISHAPTVQGADPSLYDLVLKKLGCSKTPSQVPAPDFGQAFNIALSNDEELRDLFNGAWQKRVPKTRSEAEFRLVMKLVRLGFSDIQIETVMSSCKIGKWQEKEESYHKVTIEKARRYVTESVLKKHVSKSSAWAFSTTEDGHLRAVRGESSSLHYYACKGCSFRTDQVDEARRHQEIGQEHWFVL
jgi:hypothetical protein